MLSIAWGMSVVPRSVSVNVRRGVRLSERVSTAKTKRLLPKILLKPVFSQRNERTETAIKDQFVKFGSEFFCRAPQLFSALNDANSDLHARYRRSDDLPLLSAKIEGLLGGTSIRSASSRLKLTTRVRVSPRSLATPRAPIPDPSLQHLLKDTDQGKSAQHRSGPLAIDKQNH